MYSYGGKSALVARLSFSFSVLPPEHATNVTAITAIARATARTFDNFS